MHSKPINLLAAVHIHDKNSASSGFVLDMHSRPTDLAVAVHIHDRNLYSSDSVLDMHGMLSAHT